MKNDSTASKKPEATKDAPMMVQILILALICFVGELMAASIPINCSSPVYDFVIVYVLLQFKVIKLEWIEKLSNILAGCMLLAFVPGTVSIIDEMEQLLQMIFPALIASTLGSVIVLAVSGCTVQGLMWLIKKLKGDCNGSNGNCKE